MTLGSFFDGIGGWQLAAVRAGIMPIWSSEIDPFPAAVTNHHFPDTVQLGDITQIDPAKLVPVDIVCAGSPCQDLSIAGTRSGLNGERSGLFRTAVRLFHRLRKRTGRPRFFIWENVPGAFSSNGGHDFRAVLEEIGAHRVPMPSGDKWASAGVAELPRCQNAWRVLDAQFFGVAQRRRRIFLVADFAARERCAAQILFEPEGLPRHLPQSVRAGQDAPRAARARADLAGAHHVGRRGKDEGGAEIAKACASHTPWDKQNIRIQKEEGKASSLLAGEKSGLVIPPVFRESEIAGRAGSEALAAHQEETRFAAAFKIGASKDAGSIGYAEELAPTLCAMASGNKPAVLVRKVYDIAHRSDVCRPIGEKSNTLTSRMGTGGHNVPIVQEVWSFDSAASNSMKSKNPHSGCRKTETARTLKDGSAERQTAVCFAHRNYSDYKETDRAATLKAQGGSYGGGTETLALVPKSAALCAADAKGAGNQLIESGKYAIVKKGILRSLRRFTPLECERLQGLPDHYTNIEGMECSLNARYKAIGNGMAQPCADFILRRLAEAAGAGIPEWEAARHQVQKGVTHG